MRARKFLYLIPSFLVLTACGGGTTEKAAVTATPVPDTFRVKFETSNGDFVVEVVKAWSPEGAERFYRLVERRFYNGTRFFRVVRGFIVQWGINGDPILQARWRTLTIADDPAKESNKRGTICFATSGPNSRTTQVFINLKDNPSLDEHGFTPFGRVVEGMEQVVDRLYDTYGDSPPRGQGPIQAMIESQGNVYLESRFPRLDYIKTARIVTP